jgi:G3E family GTPase
VNLAVIFYDGNEINVDLTAIADQTDIKIYDMLGGCLLIKVLGKMIHRFTITPKMRSILL